MSSNSVSKILFLKYSDFSLLYRNMDIKSDSGAVSEIKNILLEIGGKTILVIKWQRTWPVFQCLQKVEIVT